MRLDPKYCRKSPHPDLQAWRPGALQGSPFIEYFLSDRKAASITPLPWNRGWVVMYYRDHEGSPVDGWEEFVTTLDCEEPVAIESILNMVVERLRFRSLIS